MDLSSVLNRLDTLKTLLGLPHRLLLDILAFDIGVCSGRGFILSQWVWTRAKKLQPGYEWNIDRCSIALEIAVLEEQVQLERQNRHVNCVVDSSERWYSSSCSFFKICKFEVWLDWFSWASYAISLGTILGASHLESGTSVINVEYDSTLGAR